VDDLDKSRPAIREMFSRIARRYDRINHILSLNSDRGWRRQAAGAVAAGRRRVLDLACGTGDLYFELKRRGRAAVGADFCLDMLALARRKARAASADLVCADALALPFPDGSFDAVTVAFGVRNFADLGAGLAEVRRVLAPGGRIVVLEFSRPRGPLAPFLRLHSRFAVPAIGGAISGDPRAYRYLNRSVRAWPDRRGFDRTLEAAGYDRVRSTPLSLGVAALHEGVRP
jgi:demethylmenaquinone methyltransferase/2-methoxy-6-polyprenyl-1,4-benzoquinol methylase